MLKQHKLSDKLGSTVGVGILSWKSHKTLERSLQSYEKVGFKELFDEVKIIFQEISADDIALANKYGYDYVGTEKNLGIQHGHKLIYENLNTDFVLVLENDNPIVENELVIQQILEKSMNFLRQNKIDVMRLRHRWNFGESFSLEKYLNYYNVTKLHPNYIFDELDTNKKDSFSKFFKKIFRKEKALRVAGYGLYFEQNPHEVFPEFVEKVEDEIYIVNSRILTWTNQSVLLKREFYGKLLEYSYKNPSSRTANGFQDLEKPLNSKWWRTRNFKIGICNGLFTHNRFDDSWRKSHQAFNSDIKN